MNPILVEAMRGGAMESAHRGALAIVDADGGLVLAAGDVDRPIFPRSAAKVLQALPLVASGAADALGLTDTELALACASHGGEALHAETAASMLAKADLDVTALECGTHWPYLDSAARVLAAQRQEPSALHNNCSGKHAGFLCLACALHGRERLREYACGYVAHDHPVMREVGAAIEAATGCDLAAAPRGVDGCSIPAYAIALRRLALGFARVATGIGLSDGHARAAARLRAAVAHAPYLVAGVGRFDTRVMERLGARVFCKVGAEGVYCAALPEAGVGVAIKIDDGNTARAAEVAMAAVIEAAVRLDDAEAAFMRSLSDVRLANWNGIEVGRLRASDGLRRLLAPVSAASATGGKLAPDPGCPLTPTLSPGHGEREQSRVVFDRKAGGPLPLPLAGKGWGEGRRGGAARRLNRRQKSALPASAACRPRAAACRRAAAACAENAPRCRFCDAGCG